MNISSTAKRNFLTLLTAIFAVDALFSVFSLLQYLEWIPAFDVVTSSGSERSVTAVVLKALNIALELFILGKLLTFKDFGLTVKSKVGLVLLMIHSVCGLFVYFLDLFVGAPSWVFSLITAGPFVLSIIGIFMFINGAPVEKKLRRFVKWTPFLSLIASCIMAIPYLLAKGSISTSVAEQLVYTSLCIAIYLIVNRMARREIEVK